MTKFVVITSINEPTEAMRQFAKWKGWQTIVVGDSKTPQPWDCDGVKYLDLEEQNDLFGNFAQILDENSYTRKMMGYAYAIKHGATVILETDDDNIPYADATCTLKNIIENEYTGEPIKTNSDWLNPYPLFGVFGCWPRGFPLERIHEAVKTESVPSTKPWAVMQFLVNIDADVDAIYRMIYRGQTFFTRSKMIVIDDGTICPINSQATLWKKELFPMMFLPIGVSDRVTDILRGYIVASCLGSVWRSLAVASPIFYQKRNRHNLHDDFLQEIPLYQNAEAWSRMLSLCGSFHHGLRKLIKARALHKINLQAYDMFLEAAGL